MPQNFFITGMPKAGKTTMLRRIIDELKGRGLKVGGFITPEKKEHGTRSGFFVEDIETGKIAMLASTKPAGPKVSKYYVKTKPFESVSVSTMENVDMYDVFVIDEIGRMELKSGKFTDLLDKIFESPTPVIASIHRDFIDRYGIEGEVVILTVTNREAIFLDLVNKTTAAYVLKKPKKVFRPGKPKKAKEKKKPRKGRAKKVKPEKKEKAKKKPRKKRAKKRFKERKPPKRKEKPKPKRKPEKKGILGSIRELIGI